MLRILQMRLLPVLRSARPMMTQISLKVHVKTEQEYHSRAYAIRVFGDTTELLVSDKNKKLNWVDMALLDAVEE